MISNLIGYTILAAFTFPIWFLLPRALYQDYKAAPEKRRREAAQQAALRAQAEKEAAEREALLVEALKVEHARLWSLTPEQRSLELLLKDRNEARIRNEVQNLLLGELE